MAVITTETHFVILNIFFCSYHSRDFATSTDHDIRTSIVDYRSEVAVFNHSVRGPTKAFTAVCIFVVELNGLFTGSVPNVQHCTFLLFETPSKQQRCPFRLYNIFEQDSLHG